jgi:hypothetical protein
MLSYTAIMAIMMLCRRAEEEAAKAAAAEAKKARDAEKQAMKKERQRLRKLADGGEGQQRLLSIGAWCDVLHVMADVLCNMAGGCRLTDVLGYTADSLLHVLCYLCYVTQLACALQAC